MNRPVGVTVIAILQLIGGIFSILAGFFVIGVGRYIVTGGVPMDEGASPTAFGGVTAALGSLILLLGVLSIVLSIGMFQVKGWAWLGTLIVQGLNILFAVVFALTGGGINFVGLILAGIIVYYLLRPEVKSVFGRSGEGGV
jgi:hypothetical protein